MTQYGKITVLYSRLSVGDEDRGGGESNSIVNQDGICQGYFRRRRCKTSIFNNSASDLRTEHKNIGCPTPAELNSVTYVMLLSFNMRLLCKRYFLYSTISPKSASRTSHIFSSTVMVTS